MNCPISILCAKYFPALHFPDDYHNAPLQYWLHMTKSNCTEVQKFPAYCGDWLRQHLPPLHFLTNKIWVSPSRDNKVQMVEYICQIQFTIYIYPNIDFQIEKPKNRLTCTDGQVMVVMYKLQNTKLQLPSITFQSTYCFVQIAKYRWPGKDCHSVQTSDVGGYKIVLPKEYNYCFRNSQNVSRR